MKSPLKRLTTVVLTALLATGAWGVSADWGRDDDRRRFSPPPPRLEHNYRLDQRHHHNRYYPPAGVVVDRLPRHPLVIRHRDTPYYFHSGVWYRPSGTRFVVALPPIGLTIPILPPYYTTIWVGGMPYYYADGIYYAWRPELREYMVVEAPTGPDVVALPPEPEQLFVYPRQGQSEQQMATDRYECHRWAVTQTDFDPSQPPTGLTDAQLGAERADYQRATKACLEARGYSVR